MLDLALSLDNELREAVRIADHASTILRDARVGLLKAHRKPDNSIVTEADLASDEFIRRELTRLYPEDGLLSEESAYQPGKSGRTWIIDPLDGTSGYADGGDDYAVQIGLIVDGKALLGVVAEPETRRIYRAIAGVGTFMSSDATGTMRQLRVSKVNQLNEMILVTSSRFPLKELEALSGALGTRAATQTPSVGCKIGQLTRRDADIYFSVHPVSYWDSCAPQVILEAAGGVISTPNEKLLSYDLSNGNYAHSTPLIATNGHNHRLCCERLRNHLENRDR